LIPEMVSIPANCASISSLALTKPVCRERI
jgi:hypothetical protein